MGDIPVLSVIVPVYNVERYLPQCVDSVLSCGGDDIELILVDDGSTDESGAICDRYAATRGGVRVLHKANGGLSSARNAGMDVAKGRYFQFLDSDDWIDPRGEGSLLDLLREGLCDLYLVDGTYEFPGSSLPMRRLPSERVAFPSASDLLWEMKRNRCYAVEACRSVCRREVVERGKLRFAEGIVREDEDWTPRAYFAAESACNTGIELYRYRQRGSSLTRGGRPHAMDVMGTLYRQLDMLNGASGSAYDFLANNIVDLFQFAVLNEGDLEEGSYEKAYRAVAAVPPRVLLPKQRVNRALYGSPRLYRFLFKQLFDYSDRRPTVMFD